MKKITLLITIALIAALIFLSIKTFTLEEICGWQGVGEKEWPCTCIGAQTTVEQETIINSQSSTQTRHYCFGLNLSCSPFILDNFHSPTSQRPIDCQTFDSN